MSERFGALLSGVADYYGGRLAEHGATSRGVDWNGPESHRRRHAQFLRLIDDPQASVIDLGCGFGDFLGFLRETGHRGGFVGYDVAPGMIEAAREKFAGDPDARWRVGATPGERADFAIASGIFNVRRDVGTADWEDYVLATIDDLAKAGRRGFGFNVLTLSSDPERRRADLHYADPVAMLGHCLRRFGPFASLLQDYGLFEFTLLVRHRHQA